MASYANALDSYLGTVWSPGTFKYHYYLSEGCFLKAFLFIIIGYSFGQNSFPVFYSSVGKIILSWTCWSLFILRPAALLPFQLFFLFFFILNFLFLFFIFLFLFS